MRRLRGKEPSIVPANEALLLERRLPVTPGPIVPAREQLGVLLLEQGKPDLAQKEFQTALVNAPGRRGALRGLKEAEGLQKGRAKGE